MPWNRRTASRPPAPGLQALLSPSRRADPSRSCPELIIFSLDPTIGPLLNCYSEEDAPTSQKLTGHYSSSLTHACPSLPICAQYSICPVLPRLSHPVHLAGPESQWDESPILSGFPALGFAPSLCIYHCSHNFRTTLTST